uniref:Uncharacterized protein n=1 Tax=Rousettus aegyptiacus TaxID=9407 RepID=A0A7J8GB96_ROUAE|nr:hypothetical protein HJG63_011767 [Rousettus aegyptiacus]
MTSVKNPFPVRSHSEDLGTELQHTNLGRTQFNPEQKAAENFKLRRCVGNHPSAEGRGTAVLPSSSLGHGPGRTQKGGLSWLHGVREPAEKFCQLDGGLRGWVPGPTRGCLRAHAWALLLAVGWGFLTPRPPRGCQPVCRSGFRRQVSQGPAEAGQPRRPCGVFPATHRLSGGVPSRLSTSPAPGENRSALRSLGPLPSPSAFQNPGKKPASGVHPWTRVLARRAGRSLLPASSRVF